MENHGIRLKRFNTLLISISLIFSVFLTYAAVRTINSYREMRADTERYIESERQASDLQSGSDYLTEQVRTFVVTGDPTAVERYFEEVHVTRRRDAALEALGEYVAGTESFRLLSSALDTSNELMEREYYAMRLVIEARGYSVEDYSEELRAVVLTAEDLALSPEQQTDKARSLVFDEVYQAYKDAITTNVNLCVERLTGEMRREQMSSSDRLLTLLRVQVLLIVVMLLSVLAAVVLTSRLVIQPLQRAVGHIQNQELLPVSGSSELRYLAQIYNEMFVQQRKNRDQLSYEASHDSLTGLYNRSAFEKFRQELPLEDMALLLIDVDHFKTVNDTYGHDVGDRALRAVAAILRESFRSEDLVCRIGGDEFAVIMAHAGKELRDLIAGKILRANDRLAQGGDGLPALSLSVGVAFGNAEAPQGDLFKAADLALYRIKEGGRRGCAFYGFD